MRADFRGRRRNKLAGAAAGLQLDCDGVRPGARCHSRTATPLSASGDARLAPLIPPRSPAPRTLQTGAGKSFSMEGAAGNQGLVPRIFKRSFELFGGDADIKSFEISLQFLELYNEQLQARTRTHIHTL